jgi:hypothetical protein
VKVVDQGAGKFTLDQIKAGNIQLSMLYFPANAMKLSIDSLVDAQAGKVSPHFVDDSLSGTAVNPLIITKANVDTAQSQG